MRTYDCQVYLGGSRLNQVPRQNVSAPEIMVLRRIHGDDAVVDIKFARTIPGPQVDHAAERERLAETYGAEHVSFLFGPDHQPLPTKLPGEIVEDSQAAPRGRPKQEAAAGMAA